MNENVSLTHIGQKYSLGFTMHQFMQSRRKRCATMFTVSLIPILIQKRARCVLNHLQAIHCFKKNHILYSLNWSFITFYMFFRVKPVKNKVSIWGFTYQPTHLKIIIIFTQNNAHQIYINLNHESEQKENRKWKLETARLIIQR